MVWRHFRKKVNFILSLDVIYCRKCYFTGPFPNIDSHQNCSDFLEKLAKIDQKYSRKLHILLKKFELSIRKFQLSIKFNIQFLAICPGIAKVWVKYQFQLCVFELNEKDCSVFECNCCLLHDIDNTFFFFFQNLIMYLNDTFLRNYFKKKILNVLCVWGKNHNVTTVIPHIPYHNTTGA